MLRQRSLPCHQRQRPACKTEGHHGGLVTSELRFSRRSQSLRVGHEQPERDERVPLHFHLKDVRLRQHYSGMGQETSTAPEGREDCVRRWNRYCSRLSSASTDALERDEDEYEVLRCGCGLGLVERTQENLDY